MDSLTPNRLCWVCYTYSYEMDCYEWVAPCRCKGSLKYVHERCIYRWIIEKRKIVKSETVLCSHCLTPYRVFSPKVGKFVLCLTSLDSFIYNISPICIFLIISGCVYFCALSYGAITLIQIYGSEQALDILQTSDLITFYFGYTSIPILLLTFKFIRWDLFFVHPILRYIFPQEIFDGINNSESLSNDLDVSMQITCGSRVSRAITSALFLPTIATTVGNLLYKNVDSGLKRAFFGGLTYLAVKGILNIYMKKALFYKSINTRVLNFDDNNQSPKIA